MSAMHWGAGGVRVLVVASSLMVCTFVAHANGGGGLTRPEQHQLRYSLESTETPEPTPRRRVKPLGIDRGVSREASEFRSLLRREGITVVPSGDEKGELRREAIRQAAINAGIYAGFDWRYGNIRLELEERSNWLSAVYNFDQLLIDGVLLPPVIDTATNMKRRVNDTVAVSTGTQYVINQPGRIVVDTPTWRDFLMKEIAPAPPVPSAALPDSDEEEEIWRNAASQGWDIGVQHAAELFDAHINLLTTTYRGMVIARRLVSEGILSAPQVAEAQRGVVREGNRLSIDDRVVRVVAPSEFEDARYWQVITREAESR